MSSKVDTGVHGAEPADRCWFGAADPVGSARAALPKPNRIGLLAHCGTGNLGDEATIATVLQNIRARWPTAFVAGMSMDPEDSTRRHGIPCFPMRQRIFPFEQEWSSASHHANPGGYADRLKTLAKKAGPLFRIANAIRRAMIVRPAQFMRELLFLSRSLFFVCQLDMIIICGGGQLLDWGGPWAFPYTLFKWMLLAKCAGVKCVFLNSGAGPLNGRLSRWFVRRTLNMADYVSLRDRASGELLRKIGFRGKMRIVADNVWCMRLPKEIARKPVEAKASEAKTSTVIGIAPMAYGDSSRHWVNDDQGYCRLIDSLAEFCGQMLGRGYKIKLFSSDIWFDSQAIVDLDAAVHERYPALALDRVVIEPITNITDMLAALSGVDCYVTCRFHGVVFASLLNVPSVALSPHPKVATLMGDLGLSEYCVDISNCSAEDVTARVDRVIAEMDEVKARVGYHVAQFQSRLTLQFDTLFLENSKETHIESEDAFSIGSAR